MSDQDENENGMLRDVTKTYYAPAQLDPEGEVWVDYLQGYHFDAPEPAQLTVDLWNQHEPNENYFVVRVTKIEMVERV